MHRHQRDMFISFSNSGTEVIEKQVYHFKRAGNRDLMDIIGFVKEVFKKFTLSVCCFALD